MAISNKRKREHLISFLDNYLATAQSLMEYFKDVSTTRKGTYTCKKSLKEIEEARRYIKEIKHIDILDYLYGTFVGNNAIAYSVSGKVVNSKMIKHYDTKNGFDEFLKMVDDQRKENEERERKRQESAEALKKAKEMGKKVAMVYDDKTKTTRPMIIEDKENA